MALKSMTGFARADGSWEETQWHWEIRTVNGRGLDLRLRLPPGYEALEQLVREACAKRLSRGNCTIVLNVQRLAGQTEVRLNESVFLNVVEAVQKAKTLVDAAPPSLDGLLALKGVLEVCDQEEAEADLETRRKAMLASFEEALKDLCIARGEEGARLQTAIGRQLDTIEDTIRQIEQAPARSPAAIAEKLKEQLARLLDADNRLDADRLHQEAILLATKADIAEEIERLNGHIRAGRELLASAEPIGRRFDFLAQEFNREANTICSKSNDSLITRLGLEAKTVVDQMREQVQNIE